VRPVTDGSGWYTDTENFMPLCSGKMKGQAQTLSGNVYMYPQWGPQCMRTSSAICHGCHHHCQLRIA
jgi:hypothetical protein